MAENVHAIAGKLGVTAPVIVLTRDELAGVVAANPFPGEQNHKCLHAVFRAAPADEALLDRIAKAESTVAAKGSRDSVRAVGRTLYLHTPDGFGRSDLAVALMRITGSPGGGPAGTARNWATTLKLLALCAQ